MSPILVNSRSRPCCTVDSVVRCCRRCGGALSVHVVNVHVHLLSRYILMRCIHIRGEWRVGVVWPRRLEWVTAGWARVLVMRVRRRHGSVVVGVMQVLEPTVLVCCRGHHLSGMGWNQPVGERMRLGNRVKISTLRCGDSASRTLTFAHVKETLALLVSWYLTIVSSIVVVW